MSGTGRGGDNRKNRRQSFKRKGKENSRSQNRDVHKGGGKSAVMSLTADGKQEKKRGSLHERPKWVPPQPPAVTMPEESCHFCGKPIMDICMAISDPDSGKLVDFDCAINSITSRERLEAGDTVSYIGGGRFGIVHYNNPPDTKDFTITKIFEWENRENRSEWRDAISDHFSVT